MAVPLYVFFFPRHFSFVAFNVLSLSSVLSVSLLCVSLCSSLALSCLISLCFLDLTDSFLSHVREVFSYYFFKYFLRSFLSLFSFWDPIVQMLVHLLLSLRSLRLSSFFFFFILFIYSVVWQGCPPFCPPSHLFIILPQLFCC